MTPFALRLEATDIFVGSRVKSSSNLKTTQGW